LLLKNGLKFPLKAVFTSSETLLPSQREVIEEAFQCKVFDFLGMAERVVFATECQAHNGYHINSDYALNEIVDSDGKPVSDGQVGYIVGTSLRNFGMPFIRYLTSDVSSIIKEPCSCGRLLPRLAPVTTKDEDLIITPEGRIIASSVLTHPFKPLKTIIESQIIQESVDELVVKIVKAANFMPSEGEQLVSGLRERLGNGIKIRLEFVDTIPRTAAGKLRWVISKVRPPL
jgi:phenylacetate-CoA ligase